MLSLHLDLRNQSEKQMQELVEAYIFPKLKL